MFPIMFCIYFFIISFVHQPHHTLSSLVERRKHNSRTGNHKSNERTDSPKNKRRRQIFKHERKVFIPQELHLKNNTKNKHKKIWYKECPKSIQTAQLFIRDWNWSTSVEQYCVIAFAVCLSSTPILFYSLLSAVALFLALSSFIKHLGTVFCIKKTMHIPYTTIHSHTRTRTRMHKYTRKSEDTLSTVRRTHINTLNTKSIRVAQEWHKQCKNFKMVWKRIFGAILI